MSDFSVLQGLAGGGIGATVVACMFIIYKCFQGRKCHSESGCIKVDFGNALSPTPRIENPEAFETPPLSPRTPFPSVNLSEIKVINT